MKHRVFVYGTLKQNNPKRGLNQFSEYGDPRFVGVADTTESVFDMYSFGDFPGVTIGGDSKIKGEVWEVDNEIMDILDQIEGYPLFYNRTVIQTTRGPAWMYYIHDHKDVEDLPSIQPTNGYLLWD